uniref:Transmembrane protein 74 n=1 Tax=Denticeps clupeoides TaxID=299321 RepID=A0AAY4EAU3_9TELE
EEAVTCPASHAGRKHDKVRVCCDAELETSFAYVDENVNLTLVAPDAAGLREPSLAASDNDLSSEVAGYSADYGFIGAVACLVTGISLVAISYAVPRGVTADPDTVSAREMERLEREGARVGAHLDRCVIAGLCLLTLGGAVLSTLLMVSMWKGEVYRRKAFACSKRRARLYGSVNFKTRCSNSCSLEEPSDERRP